VEASLTKPTSLHNKREERTDMITILNASYIAIALWVAALVAVAAFVEL